MTDFPVLPIIGYVAGTGGIVEISPKVERGIDGLPDLGGWAEVAEFPEGWTILAIRDYNDGLNQVFTPESWAALLGEEG